MVVTGVRREIGLQTAGALEMRLRPTWRSGSRSFLDITATF